MEQRQAGRFDPHPSVTGIVIVNETNRACLFLESPLHWGDALTQVPRLFD